MRPKPMVEIGGKPILWHIMKIYAAHGINDFVICLGYKGYVIKEYFANYFLHASRRDLRPRQQRHGGPPADGRAVAGDAGRHRRGDDDRRAAERGSPTTSATSTFCFTYGDGVADVDIGALIALPPQRRGGWRR